MARHNHLAVWVSIILCQLVGFLTYTYILADQWIAGQPYRWPAGSKHADMKMEGSEMAMPFVIDVIGTILMCYFLSWLTIRLGISTAGKGIMLGLMIVFGLLVKALGSHYAFLGMSREVTLIDCGFTSFLVVLVCLILAVWRKGGTPEAA